MTNRDTSNDGKEFYDNQILRVREVPPGFVPTEEFARRSGVHQVSISKAKNSGRFEIDNMVFVGEPGGKTKLYIDWDREGPKYIMSRPPEKWPEGFTPPPVIPAGSVPRQFEKAPPPPPPDGTGIHSMADANLKKVKLDIRKKELELLKSENAVIEIEEVAGFFAELSQGIRQKLLGVVPRLAPVLAAEKDLHTIAQLLEQEITRTLLELTRGDEYIKKQEDLRDGA